MGALIDLTGQRFGRLTVVKRTENSKNNSARWECICDCGNRTEVLGTKLTRGLIVSCGCYRKRKNGESQTRLHTIWRNMHERCENPKRDHYERYEGRGIRVCKEWRDFFAFKNWAIKNGYSDTLSIDRINVNGDYEPNNCRWVSQKQQMNNISTNRILIFRNREYTVTQLAELFNVPVHKIRNDLRAGYNIEQIADRVNYEL